MHFLSNYSIQSKVVRDPLYTFIELPLDLLPIIDHKLFQRLRWVSQLPLEQLVYPSAQHSRFEHSIGVMYLAMLAAVSLLQNSRSTLNAYFRRDPDFCSLDKREKEKQFILSAGLSGLLHDVGHAPFSHTLEEACKYSKLKYKYDHEQVGYRLARFLVSDNNLSNKIFAKKTLQVLNKDLTEVNSDLEPIEMVIRNIIDGPIDVDKGDYVYRDSYHCGTNYGFYDIQRLWRHICIVPGSYNLQVTKKGALEAWTLRFQRYKMHTNIYKHHIRNITDAMLIDILASCFEHFSRKKNILRELIPISNSPDDLADDEVLNRFMVWTDDSIIRVISNQNIPASNRVSKFLSRQLYKPSIYYNLSDDYPEILYLMKKSNRINLELREIKKELHEKKSLDFDFLINKEELPPVFDSSVQQRIRVFYDSNKSESLAEYLGFQYPATTDKSLSDNGEFPLGYKIYLRFFIDKNCKQMVERILKPEIDNFLKQYKSS